MVRTGIRDSRKIKDYLPRPVFDSALKTVRCMSSCFRCSSKTFEINSSMLYNICNLFNHRTLTTKYGTPP